MEDHSRSEMKKEKMERGNRKRELGIQGVKKGKGVENGREQLVSSRR